MTLEIGVIPFYSRAANASGSHKSKELGSD